MYPHAELGLKARIILLLSDVCVYLHVKITIKVVRLQDRREMTNLASIPKSAKPVQIQITKVAHNLR